MITRPPLPARLSALARGIGHGNYEGMRVLHGEVKAYASRCGIEMCDLIREWAVSPKPGLSATSFATVVRGAAPPKPDEAVDGDDEADDGPDPEQSCSCSCSCRECRADPPDCAHCSDPDCDNPGCVHEESEGANQDDDDEESDDDRRRKDDDEE